MTKHNGKGKIHLNRLVPSDPDVIALGMAVEERFIRVLNQYVKQRGVKLVPPLSMNRDMYCWREMCIRHKKGDYRHTEGELKSTKAIAQWTLDINCTLRGQSAQTIQWKED